MPDARVQAGLPWGFSSRRLARRGPHFSLGANSVRGKNSLLRTSTRPSRQSLRHFKRNLTTMVRSHFRNSNFLQTPTAFRVASRRTLSTSGR
eukprot:2812233-Alexandrium_andersonii.AAC.1